MLNSNIYLEKQQYKEYNEKELFIYKRGICMGEIKTLIDEEKLQKRVKEIAKQIEEDYKGKEITLICILKGSVFNITDAVGSGDAQTALSILENLIIMKEPAIKIRFMLMRHLKQLICAKDLGRKDAIISRLKLQPFIADKLLRQANRFSMDTLLKLYIECSRQDMEIKHGNLDPRHSLESFIILSCGK